jgi:hypothetical protein
VWWSPTVGSPDAETDTLPVPVYLPPFGDRKDIFAQYAHEQEVRDDKVVDIKTFYAIWAKDFPHVSIPQATKLSKCDECIGFARTFYIAR